MKGADTKFLMTSGSKVYKQLISCTFGDKMTFNIKAFGLACGILWGIVVLIMGLLNITTGYATFFMILLKDVYIAIDPTILGTFVGAVIGFFDGLIGGAIFAWLYNMLEKI